MKPKHNLRAFMKSQFSFWHYQTPEDKAARDIWAALMLSLGLFSTLTFL